MSLRPHLLTIAALLLCACEPTPPLLQPVVTRLPEGGAVATLVTARANGTTRTLATTRQGLFALSESGQRWDRVQTTWPKPWGQHMPPTRSMMRGAQTFTYPQRERIAQAYGALWMLAEDTNAQIPRLLWSKDGGKTWKRAPLPSLHNQATGRQDIKLRRAPIWSRDTLRLTQQGGSLYLLDDQNIWQLTSGITHEQLQAAHWIPVDLRGIDLARTTARDALPASLRHYLPASPSRNFELLTVLGDQLMVYRRDEGMKRWTLTSILATLDRQLQPHKDTIYLMSNDGLWRMEEQGERWRRVRTPTHASPLRHLWVAPRGATMLLGTTSGSIWHSPDLGGTWTQTRGEDTENRGITSLLQSAGYLWASTAGAGVLRSGDDGQTWEEVSAGLHAARPLAMEMTPDSEILLGTDAGTFALGGAPMDGNWTQRHAHGTSALWVDLHKRAIHSGTLTGRVVTINEEGTLSVPPTTPLKGRDVGLYTPWSTREFVLDAPAILTILGRPGTSNLYAQSSGAGAMFEADDGAMWLPLPTPKEWHDVLRGAPLTSMDIAGGSTLFRTNMASADLPAQLWRSDDAGATWHAVYTFPRVETGPLQVLSLSQQNPNLLLSVQAHALRMSKNGGVTWTDLPGPWEEDPILVARRQGDTILLLTEHEGLLELHHITDLANLHAWTTMRLDLNAAESSPSRIVDVMVDAQFVYLRTGDEVLVSSKFAPRENLPQSLSIPLTAAIVLALSLLSFGVLRRWG